MFIIPEAYFNSVPQPTPRDNGYFSNGYQPNNIGGQKLTKSGTTIGQTGLKGSKNMAGSNMDNQAIWTTPDGTMYIWVGADGKSTYNNLDGSDVYGYYQMVGEKGKLWDNLSSTNFSSNDYAGQFKSQPWTQSQANIWAKQSTTNNNNNTTTKPSTGSGGGGVGGGTDPQIKALQDTVNELAKQNKAYLDKLNEKPKVYTARELAEQYDIADKYDVGYWNNIYDDATNEYYDNAIAEQNKLRSDYAYQNSLYDNEIINDYLKSYKNAAPTASARGAMAASALSAQSLQDIENSYNDMGMLDSVNQLKQDRVAELAKNKAEALSTYQGLGSYLMNLGSDHNKSDVTDYTNTLYNISTRYGADRAYSQALADAASARYAGLAQAAGTRARGAADSYSNTAYQQLWKLYDAGFNRTGKPSTAYLNGAGYGR